MKNCNFISLHTRKNGLVDIRAEDISMITLPSLRYFLSFRGYGALVTLKNGQIIHTKEEPHEVRTLIKKSMEE